MKESAIEKYLKDAIEKLGGLCEKWVSPGRRGVPDRIVLLPNGRVVFVELKKPTGTLSVYQKYFQFEMEKRKADVRCLYSVDQVKDFLSEVSREIHPS